MGEHVSAADAKDWVLRWELQQEQGDTGREERFSVVGDVLALATAECERPYVLDLFCGPGSLAARLARRLPRLDLVGVDADPLLLGLGQRMHGERIRFVDTVVGAEDWAASLRRDGPFDAVVSAAALHRLPERTLLEVYAQVHSLLQPGGILVNADRLPQEPPAVAGLADRVGRLHAERHRMPGGEGWSSWWAAAGEARELAGLFAERRRRGLGGEADNGLSLPAHLDLLKKAGFGQSGTVWQRGDSCVLVAVRDAAAAGSTPA